MGVVAVLVVPSPKSQSSDVKSPVELFVKLTDPPGATPVAV